MILVSAGHHARDPGACNGAFCEHDEAVRWQQRVLQLLRNRVACDAVPPGLLSNKIRWINQQQANLVIEIHFNCNVAAHGSETLYMPGSTRGLQAAKIMQRALAAVFPPDRGVKEGWYRQDRPGIVDYPGDIDGDESHDAFLSQTRPVALIVEPEFIRNRSVIEAGREPGTEAIASALLEIFVMRRAPSPN